MDGHSSQTVKVTHKYPHKAGRVFDAWLDAKNAGRWLFATPTGTIVRSEIDAKVGGKFIMVDRRDGQDIEHIGEYLEIDRPRRLKFTFKVPKYSAQGTDVTLDFADIGDGSEVTLTHEGVDAPHAEQAAQGWGMILAGLGKTLG